MNCKRVIIPFVLFMILFYGCSSNCLKKSDLENGANSKFSQAVYSMTDKNQLREYVINNFNKLDHTSWHSDVLLLQIADYLDRQGVIRKVGNQLRDRVIGKVRQRKDLSLFYKNRGNPEATRARYLIAYASYKWGESLLAEGDSATAQMHMEAAYRYCPSRSEILKCKNIRKLLDGPKDFRVPYAKYLNKRNRYLESWKVWYELVLDDDKYIDDFKKVHNELFPESNFKTNWKKDKLSFYPKATDFRFATIAGDTMSLSQYLGKWVLLDFWATGCPPCVKDLPNLDSLNLSFERSEDKDVSLITILQERDWTRYNKLNKNKKYSLTVGIPIPTKNEKGEWERFPYDIKYLGYKMIITPDGRYFEIPYFDYPEFVDRYLLGNVD